MFVPRDPTLYLRLPLTSKPLQPKFKTVPRKPKQLENKANKNMNKKTEVYFSQDQFPGDIFWYSESPPLARRSAFVPYRENNIACKNCGPYNVNKRMIEFLRRSCTTVGKTTGDHQKEEHEKERCFRHMINERMRREKQKQSYSALHSMLPIGTKHDKNSIVQIAATKIQQLQQFAERLRRRKMELEAALVQNEVEMIKTRGTKIKVKVANPTSGVDSMVEVLNCLKKLGLKARNIRSVFSDEEFSAELEIETKVGAAEIEEALQLSLYEAEVKLRSHF